MNLRIVWIFVGFLSIHEICNQIILFPKIRIACLKSAIDSARCSTKNSIQKPTYRRYDGLCVSYTYIFHIRSYKYTYIYNVRYTSICVCLPVLFIVGYNFSIVSGINWKNTNSYMAAHTYNLYLNTTFSLCVTRFLINWKVSFITKWVQICRIWGNLVYNALKSTYTITKQVNSCILYFK